MNTPNVSNNNDTTCIISLYLLINGKNDRMKARNNPTTPAKRIE